MIIREVWESNSTRWRGRYNLYWCWLYVLLAPAMFTWDVLEWLDRTMERES